MVKEIVNEYYCIYWRKTHKVSYSGQLSREKTFADCSDLIIM